MSLKSDNLQNIRLSAFMSDSDQIREYVEDLLSSTSLFVHISGDTVDGSLAVKNSLSSSKIFLGNKQITTTDQVLSSSEDLVESKAVWSELNSLSSKLSALGTYVDIALYAEDLVNQMIVTQEATFYYPETGMKELKTYKSIVEALEANPSYEGRVNIVEDVTWSPEDFKIEGSSFTALRLAHRKLQFNLNDHVVSSKLSYLMDICQGSEVLVKNGKFLVDSTDGNRGFVICNGGKLELKSIVVEITDNGSVNIDAVRIYDRDPVDNSVFDENGVKWISKEITGPMTRDSEGYEPISGCSFKGDRFCELNLLNCHNDSCIAIWAFGPNALLVADGGAATYTRGRERAIMKPTVFYDGIVRVEYSREAIEEDTDLEMTGYGTYTIGSDHIGVDFTFGPNAKVSVNHGHALFQSNENTQMHIQGGSFVGSNGATVRAGLFDVKQEGNPTFVGTSDYHPYNKDHASGQAGSAIFIGHAVMFECNSIDESSYGRISSNTKIQSGTYISRNNTSIGSYAWKDIPIANRLAKFVEGGMLNKVPSSDPTASDYSIIAEGYESSTPAMVIKTIA